MLAAVADVEVEEHVFGGASIDAHGIALTDEVLAACRAADAVLLGAVGGPKWDTTDPAKPRPEQGLLGVARVSDCSPTSARCGRSPRSTMRARCARNGSPGPTCSSCAS